MRLGDPEQPPTLRPHDDVGDLMPLAEWVDAVEHKFFIDYDGFGELATEQSTSDVTIAPSQYAPGVIPKWATHVRWYNR